MNRAERFNRLLSILSEVVRHPGQHPSELAGACGVSERTLRRDLAELRRLGFELAYLDGYQLQGRLNLDGSVTPRTWALPIVYEQQLRLLRSSFPALVADAVQSEVEAQAPAALAELFSRAIARMASL
ncbi:MAG: HTH domain-containing protein [Chloroflexi bacterium]|nr:MAG: HTH domain-containing protein [Chloroflexota bacterium]TME16871.1 MAG: HTH domain-containing protein [Chloroflexota bacterium]TME18181.1 MAG: HTH domain-containing protein [Chloroflexota bacterium]